MTLDLMTLDTPSRFMTRAVEIARTGMRTKAGGPFGAVVVKDGVIVGEGCNSVTSKNDPTAHAEITAIRRACESLGTFTLDGASLYTTCEPCPMCTAAIFWARIGEVIYASDRREAAEAGFDDQVLWDAFGAADPRALSMHHVPDADAGGLFTEWKAMPDKTPY